MCAQTTSWNGGAPTGGIILDETFQIHVLELLGVSGATTSQAGAHARLRTPNSHTDNDAFASHVPLLLGPHETLLAPWGLFFSSKEFSYILTLMKHALKRLIKNILYGVRLLLPSPRNRAVVLVYHSIGHNSLPFTVSPTVFQQHMAWLHEQHFTVVSLDTLMDMKRRGDIPPKTITITFDDGYRDNLIEAFPILSRYNFPSTIFLMTSDFGKVRTLHGVPLEVLSEEEIRTLHASGLVAIEPHSVTHPKLNEVSAENVRREISESARIIDTLLSKHSQHFAYPKGRYNQTVLDVMRTTDMHYGYTTKNGCVTPRSVPFEIPRNGIGYDTTMIEFKAIAKSGRVTRHDIFRR